MASYNNIYLNNPYGLFPENELPVGQKRQAYPVQINDLLFKNTK